MPLSDACNIATETPMKKLVLGLAGALVTVIAAAAIFLAAREPEPPRSPALIQTGDATFGGPFELTAHTGERVRSEDLLEEPALIYFGYTWCPDVCPIDSQTLVEAAALLEAEGHMVTPVFVTVDPARDTPETLAAFAEAMHPRLLALTGTEAEIRAVADAFKVYYARVEMEDSAAGYLMNHTAYTYLAKPEGVRAVFRNGFPPEEIAGEVARILAEDG